MKLQWCLWQTVSEIVAGKWYKNKPRNAAPRVSLSANLTEDILRGRRARKARRHTGERSLPVLL